MAISFFLFAKANDYELNSRESLLYFATVLVMAILCLFDFKYVQMDIEWVPIYCVGFYFSFLLLMYYIVRFKKSKKYVPFRMILFYMFMNLVIIVSLLYGNVDVRVSFFLLTCYIIYTIFVILLVLVNFIIFIIQVISGSSSKYKNVNYKISYGRIMISVIMVILMAILINCINDYNYNRLLKKQEVVVEDYLLHSYPNYKYNVIDTYETNGRCSGVFCDVPVIRNEVEISSFGEKLIIDVRMSDLTIDDAYLIDG